MSATSSHGSAGSLRLRAHRAQDSPLRTRDRVADPGGTWPTYCSHDGVGPNDVVVYIDPASGDSVLRRKLDAEQFVHNAGGAYKR